MQQLQRHIKMQRYGKFAITLQDPQDWRFGTSKYRIALVLFLLISRIRGIV